MNGEQAISATPVNIVASTSSIISTKIRENSEVCINEEVENYNNQHSSQNGNIKLREKEQQGADSKMTDSDSKPDADSCFFKTPALPSNNKKARPFTSKRRSKASTDHANGKTNSIDQTPNSGIEITRSMVQYTDEELLREFVGIGKHSFLCSRSQQFLAKKYPGLVLSKTLEDGKHDEDMIKEIVIDEFSMLLFRSMDDFNKMKEHEDKLREQEEAHAKQKRYEENLRLGKIKKKGRKSKIELKRKKKEAKRRARRERKEQRRREQEERKQSKLVQPQQATALDEETKNKRRERKEALKMEKEKSRMEKKRQKQAKKIGEKRQKEKRSPKILSGPASSSSSIAAIALHDPLPVPFISNSTIPPQLLDTKATVKIKIEKLDTENQGPVEAKHFNNNNTSENPVGVKRSSSTAIGIATVHRNGLIQSPSNTFLHDMPPASKLAKLESGLEEYGTNSRGLLIGIATSNASQQQMAASLDNSTGFYQKSRNVTDNDLSQRVFGNISAASTSGHQYKLISQQDQLQQAFLKNPELAYNFHQSMATLYSIEPSLMAKATAGGYQFGSQLGHSNSSSLKATSGPQSQQKSQNDQRMAGGRSIAAASGPPLLSSFPHGVPLASQLATLAASQSTKLHSMGASHSIPFKTGRWCNMHAVIAHEIAKHQDQAKKAAKTPSIENAGRQSSGTAGRAHNLEKKSSITTANNLSAIASTTAISAAALSLSTSQLLHLQQQQQQEQLRNKAASSTLPSSSSFSNNANLQQQLNNLLLAQQRPILGLGQQQQQMANALNENLLTSNLLARLQAKPIPDQHHLFATNAAAALPALFPPPPPSPSSSSHQIQSQNQNTTTSQLFGGFPIQPLGPGTGSLTSGNSDAAAAARLQQQAQLLASLQQQQQQAQFAAALQQQFPQNSLAAGLLSQFTHSQGGANPAGLPLQQQQQPPHGLLSALINNNSAGAANAHQQHGAGLNQSQTGVVQQLGMALQQQQSTAAPSMVSSLSSLDLLQSLPNTNSILTNENILAAFLSGQSIDPPKVAFPPQLPPSSSSSAPIPLSSPALTIEQQLMRGQLHHQQLPKLVAASAPSAIPPPPSSLITSSLIGPTAPMNPIEQELLMRQIRIAQQQQVATNGMGELGGAAPSIGINRMMQNGQQQQTKAEGTQMLGTGKNNNGSHARQI